MSVANKIFTNTLWQLVIRVATIVVGVFNLALITRILGQTGFGFYTTVFAFVQMFMILADLGLFLTLLREISAVKTRPEESHVVNNIFTIRFFASLIVLLLVPVVIQFFPYDPMVKTGVIYFVFVFFFQSLMSTLNAVFSKKLDMPKAASIDLLNKGVYLVALFYLFKAGGDLNTVLLLHSIIFAASFGIYYLLLKKYVSLRFAWDFVYWKKVFYTTWPLAVTVVLNLIYFKADILILSAFHSPEDVGLYGAPYKVLEVLTTFPHMFMSLILPLFTAAWLSKNVAKLKVLWQYSFDFFSIVSIGMMVGTWIISRHLMILLAGEEFAASGAILDVLVVATATIFFGTLFTYMVVALGVQKKMIKYFLYSAIIGAVGYFIFIPRYSYWGAAYMTLFVEALIVWFAYLVTRRHLEIRLNYRVFNKSILAGVVALALGVLLRQYNIYLAAIVAGSSYLVVLYLTKAIDKALVKELFNKQT
jgi:O-antigen/teichoic acid export membrane protein